MKIGIEAKWYFEGPPSGQRVIKALVDYLLDYDTTNEYYIILNKKHRHLPFPHSHKKHVHAVYVWAGNNMLSNVAVLPFVMNRYGIDVTVFQNFAPLWGAGKRIAYIHDILFLSHPGYYTRWEKLYFKPLKFLTRHANAIITVSEEERQRLAAYGFKSRGNGSYVIHHGVDPVFKPRQQWQPAFLQSIITQYQLPEKFLLFVGRLNIRKNVDALLKGLAQTQTTLPLVIVGNEDWKTSNHYQTVQQLGIANRVIFLGAVYGEELAAIYALAHLFCFPSLAESFGLPALEAMASGVPVIVSGTTALPEVCGPAGNYINPEQPATIAAAIDQLLQDQQLYTQKQQQGLVRAAQLTWQNAAVKLLGCITETHNA
jgi:glycosyltransferase involved in cell wall biosynthesis